MATTAAYPLLVNIAPDASGAPGSYVAVNGLNKVDFGPKNVLIDATYFGTPGAVNRFATLVDADITLSGQFFPGAAANVISSDAGQENAFISIGLADRYIWVQWLWTGVTHGFSLQAIVESAKVSGSVAGVFEFSFSIKACSKPVYV